MIEFQNSRGDSGTYPRARPAGVVASVDGATGFLFFRRKLFVFVLFILRMNVLIKGEKGVLSELVDSRKK
jgi:hypothetical protein